MKILIHENDVPMEKKEGHSSKEFINENHGAVNGYKIGMTLYWSETYGTPGIHEDQEGFYVVSGEGTAKVGDQEFKIRPGSVFIAPKGVPHSLKKAENSEPVKLIWSHGAI